MVIMDEADRVAHQTLIERYLKRFNAFVEDHSISLIKVLDDCSSSIKSVDQAENLTKKKKNNNSTLSKNNNNSYKDSEQHINSSSILTAYGLAHNILDVTSDPVQITWGPLFVETLTYEDLITSSSFPVGSNPDVHKVMLVLCSITSQMKELREEGWKNFVTQLILYGDGIEDLSELSSGTSVTEGKGHVTIATFLSVLYELSDFYQNCILLISNCVKQLGALFKESKPNVVSVNGLYLPTVFMELARLLSLLVILDEIIASQTTLQEHWTKYKRMIKSVRADSITFAVDVNKLLSLEKDLIALDHDIMSAHLFRTAIDKVSEEIRKSLGKTSILVEKFTHHLTMWSSNLEKDFMEGIDELKPIAVASLFIFSATLFSSNFDTKKLFTRIIWENLKKIPAVPIGGTILWVPETFLNSFPAIINKFFDNKTLQLLTTSRHNFLQQKVSNLPKEILTYHLNVGSWTLRLQEAFYSKDMSQIRLEDLSLRSNLLKQGLTFSQSLLQNFRLIINLHANLGRPITKKTVSHLCQILELLKVVQSTFHRFNIQVCESASTIVQNVLHIALSNVASLEKYFTNYLRGDPKRPDDTRSDTLSVLAILKNVLKGSPTKKRLLIAQIAYEWTTASSRLWREEDDTACGILAMALERITNMLELQDKIQETCNGEHLYWHRIILPAYFTCVYQNETEAVKLPLMFLVFNDCLELMEKKSPHKEVAEKNFVREIEGYFKTCLLDKLVLDIETELRLQSHTHLNVQNNQNSSVTTTTTTATSSFRHSGSTISTVKDFKNFLQLPSLVFNKHKINLKFITENYLTKTFYNLASVALHDWQSYATMRVLAQDKYELQVLEDCLPGHTLEQGLDILEIVRNLSKFVTEFSYNLNNQVFVQVSSPNKHLDTVNIRHLANSIRTHGPGMTNTTVNFTYLFLRSRIHAFSQFLYDEQIKSRLAKEIRLFKQQQGKQQGTSQDGLLSPTGGTGQAFNFRPSSSKDALTGGQSKQSSFPYDRVLKFQRGIRKLGLTPDGLSPLDQFRVLITHIGNALGFVRLVRSGGLHFLAQGCRFVSDLEDIPNFREMTHEAHENKKIDEEIEKASLNVDSALKNLSSVVDGVDFLGLLANGFSGPLLSPKNVHLKNFYVIIPALTLSYVDHMRSCKEKLLKKSNSTSPIIFTDDGFPMGVAFLLKVLGQDQEYDSLQWFSGVTKRLNEERQQALQAIQESKKDEKLQQANILTAKRLSDSLAEFHLLRYNLSSARIFFQEKQVEPSVIKPS